MAIDNNYPAVTFTPAELKFLCLHAGVNANKAPVLTGILCYHESNDESCPELRWNSWRPMEENPKGGNDWSGAMVNDETLGWPGPWMMADPVLALRWLDERILTATGGFKYYDYPSDIRNPESIHLLEMVELEPINPYWKARDAGMFVPADMRPEFQPWIRWMPSASDFPGGLGGHIGMPVNLATIQLQDALKRMGFFNGFTSPFYDNYTKEAVKALQSVLFEAGWEPGVLDGVYGRNTANAWIRAERHRHVSRQHDRLLFLVRSY